MVALMAMHGPNTVGFHNARDRRVFVDFSLNPTPVQDPNLFCKDFSDAWKAVEGWERRIHAVLGGTQLPVVTAAILKRARKAHTPEAGDARVTQEIEKYLARITTRL
jgi:hypothetical protein